MVAVLRSQLQSLYQKVKNAENGDQISPEYIRDELESCCDWCQSAFEKLGKEKREHSQHVKQLEQEQAELKTNLAQLGNRDLSRFSSYHIILCNHHFMCSTLHVHAVQRPPAKRQRPSDNQGVKDHSASTSRILLFNHCCMYIKFS